MAKEKEKVTEEVTSEKPAKKSKSKEKKPNIFKRLGRKIKEIFSELKKVSWPTVGKVIKQTGVVLAVVIIFLVLVTGVDFGLSKLLTLLVGE